MKSHLTPDPGDNPSEPSPTTPAKYMSVKQVAERWANNTMAVYRQVASGRLPALHLGQTIRIPVADVLRFEAENTSGRQGH
ncbi:excisionase family DNA-binding protein [Rhodococcus hoagii]|nr:excisionase family DNA-binding protein [Prescottella equi]